MRIVQIVIARFEPYLMPGAILLLPLTMATAVASVFLGGPAAMVSIALSLSALAVAGVTGAAWMTVIGKSFETSGRPANPAAKASDCTGRSGATGPTMAQAKPH